MAANLRLLVIMAVLPGWWGGVGGVPALTTEEVACRGRESGVPWLRVRAHLQVLFDVDSTGPGGKEALQAAVAAALAAIAADPEIPEEAVRRLQEAGSVAEGQEVEPSSDEEDAMGCAVGLAALRLLRCVFAKGDDQRLAPCTPDGLNWDVLVALGIVGTTPMGARVRGPWPVHALVAALEDSYRQDALSAVEGGAAETQGASGADSQMQWARELGDRLLTAVRELDAQPAERSGSSPEKVATATLMAVAKREACGVSAGLLRSCPYRPPLDTILCGRGVASSTIRWGTYPAMCLDVAGGMPEDRTRIQLWACASDSEHPNQRFLSPSGGRGTIRWATHPRKCLDVKQGNSDSRNVVQLFECAEGEHPNQQFLLPAGPEGPIRWATHPEFCLDIKEGSSANGSTVQLFKCAEDDAHPNQQFIVPPAGQRDACGGGFSGGGRLAAASALVVLAAWGAGLPPTRIGGGKGSEAVASCRGLQRLCGAAFGSNASDPIWAEARSSVEEGLTTAEAGPILTVFAASPWPISHLLAALSRAFRQRRQASSPPLPADTGVCACDMGRWTAGEARAVAAAVRVLESMSESGVYRDQPLTAVLSPDAAAACDGAWELRVVQASFVVEDWLSDLGELAEDKKVVAQRLRDAGPLSWDIDACLPGVAALGMVCSTRALALNRPATLLFHTPRIRKILEALAGCVDFEHQAAFVHFMNDWAVLAPWLLQTSLFFDTVQSQAIANNSWWLGADEQLPRVAGGSRETPGASRRVSAELSAATPCSGVWDPGPDHPCHEALRKDAGATPGSGTPNGVPASRILGVGLMKAGSTAVWQALGAASQLSMGLDCTDTGTTSLPREAAQRRAPLEAVIDSCYEELFRWELAKDPLLTPVARRLADAWPALSSHGGPLRLYFVVRSPFECARSLIEHMELRTQVDSAEDQRFSWEQGRFPSRFTPGKQRYLDITSEGLEYTGYVDAIVQRWALVVDEYLACPSRFALVRYEDFLSDPVSETQRLLTNLGLPELWLPGAAERVAAAAAVQYQTAGRRKGRPPVEVFGPRQASRMAAALRTRLEPLGYEWRGPQLADDELPWPPIDMPPLPAPAC